jgi:hypothetical protein
MTTTLLAPLETDLPCLRCGYNLRTLPPTSTCPECNLPITASQAYATAHPSGLRHPTRLLIACLLLVANFAAYFIPITYSLAITVANAPLNPVAHYSVIAFAGLVQTLLLLSAVALLTTSGLLPKPETLPLRYLWLAFVLVYAFIHFSYSGIAFYEAFLLWSATSPSTAASLAPFNSWLSLAGSFIYLVLILGGGFYFSNLARSQRRPALLGFTYVLAAALALATLLGCLVGLYYRLFSYATYRPLITSAGVAISLFSLATNLAAIILFILFAHLAWQSRARLPAPT